YVAGTRIPVQVTLITTSRHSMTLHRMSVVEMADEQQPERLLEKSLASWYLLIHNVPDLIMTVESQGRIAFVNKPVWGYSAGELVGKNLLHHIPEIERPKVLRCLDPVFHYNKRLSCEITGLGNHWSRRYN